MQGEPFAVTTRDGVEIRGLAPTANRRGETALVLCHGFLGSWRRKQNIELAAALGAHYGVFLFDFRGHGESGGMSTVGDREALDVHAVVSLARSRGFERVVTFGASMGAISALREAALFKDVDGVVSVSAPGRWAGHGRAARIAGALVVTRGGRAVAKRAFGTRVYPEWLWCPPPAEMIEYVEVPVLIVHGAEDRFIPSAQAELLHARACSPKRLLVLDGFGHAEVGYSPAFADMLLSEMTGMLDGNGWGTGPQIPDTVGIRRGSGA